MDIMTCPICEEGDLTITLSFGYDESPDWFDVDVTAQTCACDLEDDWDAVVEAAGGVVEAAAGDADNEYWRGLGH